MRAYRKFIYSGDVVEIEEYYSIRQKGKKYPRRKGNINLTPQQQEERNNQNAIKKDARLVNANFREKDMFITLTYRDLFSEDEMDKHREKFIRDIRKYYRELGIEIKYYGRTEGVTDDSRPHHHIIINGGGISEDIMQLWDYGFVLFSKLEKGGDYTGLVNYINKTPSRPHKKRCFQSRNLIKPKEIVEKLKKFTNKPIKTPKGYKETFQEMYSSLETGCVKYLKAVKIGGADYAGKRETG